MKSHDRNSILHFRFFLVFVVIAVFPTHAVERGKRQVIYLEGDYPEPHDPAAIDPEVLREIENERRSKYRGDSFFDDDFLHGAFSELQPKILPENPQDGTKRITKRAAKATEDKSDDVAKEMFPETWSNKLNNKTRENSTNIDHEASPSRFRPYHGPRRRDSRGFNFRRRPEYGYNRFYPVKRTYPDGRHRYRESQQSNNPEHDSSRKFSFPGSGTPEFLSQFTTLFRGKHRKDGSSGKQQRGEASNVILGSGNFEILSGGIYPDEDDINDYDSIKQLSDSNQRDRFYHGQQQSPSKHFNAARRFLHRYFNSGGFSENHNVRLKVDEKSAANNDETKD